MGKRLYLWGTPTFLQAHRAGDSEEVMVGAQDIGGKVYGLRDSLG